MVKARTREARTRFYPTDNEYAILDILVPAMFHDFLGHNHGDANIADAINRDMKKTKYVCLLLRGKQVTPGVVSKVRKKHGLHYRIRNGNGVVEKSHDFVSYHQNIERMMEKSIKKHLPNMLEKAVERLSHAKVSQGA